MPTAALKNNKRKLITAPQPSPQRRKTTMAASTDISMTGGDAVLTEQTAPTFSLYDMTGDERQAHYKQLFSKKVEPLPYIAAPDECADWPEFKDEIVNAYLQWTTFSVNVWTNYDTTAERFYIDERTQDCGKIILKPSDWANLSTIEGVRVTRVLVDVGTPFTTLCKVKLVAAPVSENGQVIGADIRSKMAYLDSNHPRAVDFIKNRCADLDNADLGGGHAGFWISELEEIAAVFRREPTQAAVSKMRWSSDPAPWMNFEDERSDNPGWLDLEALGKGCNIGCNGCTQKKWTRFSSWTNTSSYFR